MQLKQYYKYKTFPLFLYGLKYRYVDLKKKTKKTLQQFKITKIVIFFPFKNILKYYKKVNFNHSANNSAG